MSTPRMTHIQRERAVLNDLEGSFPNFTARALVWTEVQTNRDPPDFISHGHSGPVGLELVEWLDGDQMTPAKTQESGRKQIQRILADGWEKPRNFRGAFPSLLGVGRVVRADELPLRREFYAYAAEGDRGWFNETYGRGGGDRNDRQTNKACALYALQPPPLANWNKRNKRQVQPSQVCRAADAESQQQLSV
jgi:hypothetical protein